MHSVMEDLVRNESTKFSTALVSLGIRQKAHVIELDLCLTECWLNIRSFFQPLILFCFSILYGSAAFQRAASSCRRSVGQVWDGTAHQRVLVSAWGCLSPIQVSLGSDEPRRALWWQYVRLLVELIMQAYTWVLSSWHGTFKGGRLEPGQPLSACRRVELRRKAEMAKGPFGIWQNRICLRERPRTPWNSALIQGIWQGITQSITSIRLLLHPTPLIPAKTFLSKGTLLFIGSGVCVEFVSTLKCF